MNNQELANEVINGSKAGYEAFQLNKQDMDSLYSVGYNLYQQGRYQDAEDLFLNLLLMEWNNKEYAEALALVRKDQGKWFAAQAAYKHLAIIDQSNSDQYQKEIEAIESRIN